MQSLADIYWGYVSMYYIRYYARLVLLAGTVLGCQCGNIWAHFLHTPHIYHSKPFPLEIIVTIPDCPWSLHYQSYQTSWGGERRGRGVRDIISYLEECQVSSQIAVITHSQIETDFTQLGLHVDMTGLSNVKQVIKLKHSSDDKY